MTQTIDCSVVEFLERINRGEIPRVATIRGTVDYAAPSAQPSPAETASPSPTLKDLLGYEPERAATIEETEADRAEFDQIYEGLNETRRALTMRTI